MKKTNLFLSTLMLLATLVGCGAAEESKEASSSQAPASQEETSSQAASENNEESVIKSVTITGADNLTVYGGSRVSLKATVDGPTGSKVTWASSDEKVATVKNGVVTFKDSQETKEVTITATSKDDTTKSASITFSVKHSIIDLKNSLGSFDTSNMEEEGIHCDISGGTALIFADVCATKFYVQATITPDNLDGGDLYPKFGIMVADNGDGIWCQVNESTYYRNLFYYVDAQYNQRNSGWRSFGVVTENSDHNDWDWTNLIASVTAKEKMRMDEEYTIGLLRDGTTYYLYGMNTDYECVYLKTITYTDIAAEENAYVWIGGWNFGCYVSNIICAVGDDADAYLPQN